MSVIYIDSYRFAAPAGTGDPYFNEVSLLLHGDGTNGSTTIIDSSPRPKVLTPYGNAQISTTESVFGGSSLYFPPGSFPGSHLRSPGSPEYAFGIDDFTVECFARRIDHPNPYQHVVCVFADTTGNGATIGAGWSLNMTTDLRWSSLVWSNNDLGDLVSIESATPTLINTQYHLALVRFQQNLSLYVNGQLAASAALPSGFNIAPSPATELNVATYANGGFGNFFQGYIDELRITKGVARYTSNFTPPTAPFPDF